MATDAQIIDLIRKQLIRRFEFDGATTKSALSGLTTGEWAAINNWLNNEEYEALGTALNNRRQDYIEPIKQAEAEAKWANQSLDKTEIEELFF